MSEERNEIIEERIIRLKRLSERLDETFTVPGTDYKIGIESIIGAIPLVGDLIGGIISTYIMYSGIKMGASPGSPLLSSQDFPTLAIGLLAWRQEPLAQTQLSRHHAKRSKANSPVGQKMTGNLPWTIL